MGNIKIITDSTADVPKHFAEELNITVVPLMVYFGDEAYRDWYDLSSEAFFAKLKESNIMPTTSQVTPAAFEEVFRKEAKQNDTIICFTISSKASGTYQSALIARNIVMEECGVDIEVIDSMSFSYGYGLAVVEAARMAKAGKSKAEIMERANYLLEHTDTYFIVDTLEYLQKGGRINMASAVIGSILNIKPVLGIKEGLVKPIDKIRGSKRVIPKMVEIIKNNGYDIKGKTLAMAHGAIPDKLEELKQAIQEQFQPAGFEIAEVGCVVGAHSGPGVIGAFFIRE